MKRYRHKPTVVAAVQFFTLMKPYPRGVVAGVVPKDKIDSGKKMYFIQTTNGPVPIQGGEWIIYGDNGTMWPCSEEAFKKSYEEVETDGVSYEGPSLVG